MSNYIPIPYWHRRADSSSWEKARCWPVRFLIAGHISFGIHGIEVTQEYWRRNAGRFGMPCGMHVIAWVLSIGTLRIVFGKDGLK